MWSGKFKNGETFNDLTDEEIEKFSSEIDENSVKEIKQSPVENSLYTKGLQVGYSGLSKDEQAQLDYQYAKSEASKTMSIEEVRAKMDANAAVSRKMAEENKEDENIIESVVVYVKENPFKITGIVGSLLASPLFILVLIYYIKFFVWTYKKLFNTIKEIF